MLFVFIKRNSIKSNEEKKLLWDKYLSVENVTPESNKIK